jgi:hypothetical protein
MSGSYSSAPHLARIGLRSKPASRRGHTVVVLPSYSVGDAQLAHYAERVAALENRQLLSMLRLLGAPRSRMLFITSRSPAQAELDYYLSLLPPASRDDVRSRLRIIEVPDPTPRPVSAKLLDRPDLIAEVRRSTRGGFAYIEPWNVTHAETEIARRLHLPVNGTPPELWPLGFKSSGRRLMRAAGVPVPLGVEDVRSAAGVVDAAEAIRRQRPDAVGVVVKSDDGATGAGNHVLRWGDSVGSAELTAAVGALGSGYLADLSSGGVVEELVHGTGYASPSVQLDIGPRGRVEVVSTHEQLVGGPNGQVYSGCEFPANVAYRADLARYGAAVGRLLAARGALGRLCVDFVVVQSAGTWEVFGLEINLRTSGTTHPFTLLSHLTSGHYEHATGRWLVRDGSERCYRSTDNLGDPTWRHRTVDEVVTSIRSSGVAFDRDTGTGVVLHTFTGLDIDGRIGLTAIGTSAGHADELYHSAARTLSEPALVRPSPVPLG